MRITAGAILRRVERGKLVLSDDAAGATAAWDPVSPMAIITYAYAFWVHETIAQLGDGGDRVAEVVRALFPAVGAGRFAGTADDAVLITRGLLGDFEAGAEADAKGLGTLRNLAVLLDAVRRSHQLSEAELDALLQRAETDVKEALTSGELTRPKMRDGHVGPWDVSELEAEDRAVPADQIDFGALRVPVVAGMRIRPEGVHLRGEGGHAYGVTLNLGGAFMQLQIFHAPEGGLWNRARRELMTNFEGQGGEVRETVGQLGTEVRGRLPRGESGQDPVGVRFVGCEGPGWMLRGVLTGVGADSDVMQEQMRQILLGTVVDTRDTAPLPNGLILLRWPPVGGWDEACTPVFD